MKFFDCFVFFYNFVVNTMKSIFRPIPDMRYKFFTKDETVCDSLGANLFPLLLDSAYFIEIESNNKIIKLLTFPSINNKILICGLPIIAYTDLKISVIDSLCNESVCVFEYKKGEFIEYSKILKELI